MPHHGGDTLKILSKYTTPQCALISWSLSIKCVILKIAFNDWRNFYDSRSSLGLCHWYD